MIGIVGDAGLSLVVELALHGQAVDPRLPALHVAVVGCLAPGVSLVVARGSLADVLDTATDRTAPTASDTPLPPAVPAPPNLPARSTQALARLDTLLLGFSVSKSVTNALVGILVQQGRLQVDRPGVLPAWRDPADPRHAITASHLLRQTAGLDLRQDNSGFDASTQIMFSTADKAAAAAAAPLAHAPGRHRAYADTNYLLLSRVVRDAVGGHAASVRAFMQSALFGPLGLRRARMDIDATDTGMGTAQVTATARDWARLGQLFLDDGITAWWWCGWPAALCAGTTAPRPTA